MKRYLSLFVAALLLLCLIGCQSQPAEETPNASPTKLQAEELNHDGLAKIVAKNLGVPEGLDFTYEISERFYWEAGEVYFRNVTIYVEGKEVAFAAVDPANGNLLKNIMEYDYEKLKDSYYNTFEYFRSTFTEVEEEDANYIIKVSKEYSGYSWEIYDKDGDLLDDGYHGWRGSFDIEREESLVILEYGFGGTNVYPHYRLYDIEKSSVSPWFHGPIAVHGDRVAYFEVDFDKDKAVVVVQDMFDVDDYYVEFQGKFDTSVFMKLPEIRFSEDGKTVLIKHCENGNEENVIEEEFSLN